MVRSNVETNVSCFKGLRYEWDFQCVYTNVVNDRRNILTKAREEMGIIMQKEDCNNNFQDECEECDFTKSHKSSDSESSFGSNFNHNKSIKHMILTEEQWMEIKPANSDTHLKLKPGVWTNVIAFAMWSQFRMPCAFTFKRGKIQKTMNELHVELYTISFVGVCKSKKCGNNIKGLGTKKINENSVIFSINTRVTRGEKHDIVKRPFNGKRRIDAYHALKSEGSEKYRKREAQNYMLPGDIEPPIIPRTNLLPQAKKEAFDKDLGISKQDSRDLVRSIEEMSLSPQYHGAIQEVGGFPFRVLYGLPTQFHVYQEYRRIKKTWSLISIDATGSLVKKLDRKNGTKSGYIFLYAIVINFNGTTACVYQMLSERHDSVTILTWLLRWIQNAASIPKEVTCDYSRALLIAVSMAFNKQNIKSYIHDRFKALSCGVLKYPVTLLIHSY